MAALQIFAVFLVAAVAIILGYPERSLDWDEIVLPKAKEYSGLDTDRPLANRTVVVTGATSGIGLGITRLFSSKLGATVVAIGRSRTKLEALKAELPNVIPVVADLSDLSSVARAADEIIQMENGVDILINNAGMHMGITSYAINDDGMDKVFVVNYLSHVLLTEKLLPKIRQSDKPVITQISSSFHFAVDATDLQIDQEGTPKASRPGGSVGFYIFRAQRSYCNSKLAQIFHARSVKKQYPSIRTVSVCPGWVSTNIGSALRYGQTFMSLGFSPDGWGLSSTVEAVLGNSQGDFFQTSNFFAAFAKVVRNALSSPWLYRYGIRDCVGSMFSLLALLLQRFSPAIVENASSVESYNETIGDGLHQWSLEVLAKHF